MRVRILALTCLLVLAAMLAHAAAPPVPRLNDSHGDPLPDGAAARLGTLRWRTRSGVMQPVFSPDGKWIATPDVAARTARLWDASTGRVVRTFRGHSDVVTAVAFSPDGKRLATVANDNTARLWDVASGKQMHRLGPLPRVAQVAFAADGKTVAVISDGHVVRFDVSTGKESKRIKLVQPAYHVLAPSGDRVVSGLLSGKPKLVVHDAVTGKEIREIESPGPGARPVFSNDGKRVAVRITRGPVKVWNVDDGKEVCSLEAKEVGSALTLQFTPDGKALLGDTEPGKLSLWDVATGKRSTNFTGQSMGSRAFSRDGKRLLVSEPSRLRLWDVASGKEVPGPAGMDGHCSTLAFSPDSETLVTGGTDRFVRLWDVGTRKVLREMHYADRPIAQGSAFSSDGKKVAVVGLEVVVVWDVGTGKEQHRFALPKGKNASAVVFSPDAQTLFVSGFFDSVLRWDLKAGKELEALGADKLRWGRNLELTADGKSLVVHSISGTHFYDVATGKFLRTVAGPFGSAGSVTRLSPDGKRIASVSTAAMVGIGSADDGKVIRTWKGSHAWALRYSVDGKYLATASAEVLRVYEADAGRSMPPIVGDFGEIQALAFSPDGKWLATSGVATTVLLWDVQTLRRPLPYRTSDDEWQECWDGLNLPERYTVDGYQARLHAAGDGVLERLRERVIHPPLDAKRAERLLKAAAGEDEVAGERAAAELVEMGAGVLPLIDKALKGDLEADARLRLVVARSKLPKADAAAEARLAARVVAVLKLIATPNADALLDELARGKAGRAWADAAKK